MRSTLFSGSPACLSPGLSSHGLIVHQEKLFPQAKHWFREASRRSTTQGVEPAPLLGLLQVAFLEKNEAEAETLILHWKNPTLEHWKTLPTPKPLQTFSVNAVWLTLLHGE